MIPEYRTLLYATDLTPNAARAFRHAVSIARHYDARIHILHVIPEVDAAVVNYVSTVMGDGTLGEHEAGHRSEVRDEIRRRLEAFAQEELADHPEDLARVASVEAAHGSPAAQILEWAEKLDADLIVMGSHGKGRLRHTFLGSEAERVLHKSRRPVLISRLVG